MAFRFSPQQPRNNIHYSLNFYNVFSYPVGTLTLLQLPAEPQRTSPEPAQSFVLRSAVSAIPLLRDAPTHIVEKPQATR